MKPNALARAAVLLLPLLACTARADTDDAVPAAKATAPAAPAPLVHVEGTEPTPPGGAASGEGKEKLRYSSEATWDTAGYNNEEVVYTIFVHNEDTRILRCSVQIKGTYLDKGRKLPVEDRQLATVFPDQKVQVGNWMGMDAASGASYSVSCRVL
jgi:hypothetical protein